MEKGKVSKIILSVTVGAMIIIGLLFINQNSKKGDDDTITIGILQLAEHSALDAAREGFIDELKNLGVEFNVDVKNAQGDIANTSLIANKFVSDNVDLIFAIATPAAQAIRQATNDKKIPAVFTAVTDPVKSEIVDDAKNHNGNIVGVRDSVPKTLIKELFELVQELKDDKKAIGVIYNTGETNSLIQIEEAREVAKDMGLTIEAVGITSINDIPNAMNSLDGKIDGMLIITDNMVATGIALVSNIAKEKGMITVSVDTSNIEDGIMYASGIDYYELGRQTAIIAKKILIDKVDIKDIEVEEAKTFTKFVNLETLKALDIDKDNPVFKDAETI